MTHEYERCLAVVISGGSRSKRVRDSFEIIMRSEKRLAESDAFKVCLMILKGSLQLVILVSSHQVGRLHDEPAGPVCSRSFEGFFYIVYADALSLFYDVYYHLRGEAPSHSI